MIRSACWRVPWSSWPRCCGAPPRTGTKSGKVWSTQTPATKETRAARTPTAAKRHRRGMLTRALLREVRLGVDPPPVVKDPEVEVGPGGSARGTLLADGLATPHRLAGGHEDGREVRVERAVAVPVHDDDLVPVPATAVEGALGAA